MGNNKDWYVQWVSAAPPMSEVKGPPSCHQRPCRCACLAKELGGLRRDLEHTISVPGSRYSVSPPKYQPKSRSPPSPMGASGPSLGPAINPSSDVECPVRTFPMTSVPLSDPDLLGACCPLSCLNRLGQPHTTRCSFSYLARARPPVSRLRRLGGRPGRHSSAIVWRLRRCRRRTCRTLWVTRFNDAGVGSTHINTSPTSEAPTSTSPRRAVDSPIVCGRRLRR
jgi:hypothetical protein